MKKILNILLVVALFAFHTSCEENNGYEIEGQQLKVVSSDVSFRAQGGEGSINLTSTAAIVAQSDQAWCTVTISDKKILVTADKNFSLQNRNANIIISSGGETLFVPVSQRGAVNIIEIPNQRCTLDGGEFYLDKLDLPTEVAVVDDWLKYEFKDDKLFFYADPIDAPRSTTVTLSVSYSEGSKSESFTVTQESLGYKDFLGKWKLNYVDWPGTNLNEVTVTIQQLAGGTSYILASIPTIPGQVGNLALNYVEATDVQKLVVANNQYLGPVVLSAKVYHLYTHMFDVKKAIYSTDVSYAYEGICKLNGKKMSLVFQDNEKWTNYNINSLLFAAHTTQDPNSAIASGGFLAGNSEMVMTKDNPFTF